MRRRQPEDYSQTVFLLMLIMTAILLFGGIVGELEYFYSLHRASACVR